MSAGFIPSGQSGQLDARLALIRIALCAGASGHLLQDAIDAVLPVAIEIGVTAKESRATIGSGRPTGNEQPQ